MHDIHAHAHVHLYIFPYVHAGHERVQGEGADGGVDGSAKTVRAGVRQRYESVI